MRYHEKADHIEVRIKVAFQSGNSNEAQLLNRAFYGWLSHVRHSRTVRRHLGGLAFDEPIPKVEEAWAEGVTEKWWEERRAALLKQIEEGKSKPAPPPPQQPSAPK